VNLDLMYYSFTAIMFNLKHVGRFQFWLSMESTPYLMFEFVFFFVVEVFQAEVLLEAVEAREEV